LTFVPLGNAEFLAKNGIPNATDLDWWDSRAVSADVTVQAVPAQHFSARALSDRNKTEWAGYAIKTPSGDIYFAGDTGFGPFVQEIKKRYPDGFRLALLPIGAYLPREIMAPVHISPGQANDIKNALGVRTALGIHFGTFKLAGDAQNEPVEELRSLVGSEKDSGFYTLPNGGQMMVSL
jgi:L-ascorbate metabolism protein UlaG (beta-lactamase superfamily)